MKILMLLLVIGLTTADLLDRTYLPPPGSKYSGGQSGDLQVPLEYTNGFSTTGRPQGTLAPGFPSSTPRPVSQINQGSFPSSTLGPQNLITFTSGIPTTTTSYAFTQTTTYSPIDDQNLPTANQGQTLVDENGNPIRTNFFQPGTPQQIGVPTGTYNQQPGFRYQPGTERYDQNGNIVPQTIYDKNGNAVPQVTYDQNSNVVPQTVYDKNGNVVPQVVFDKDGNISQQRFNNGTIIPKDIYDSNGNIIPQIAYDRNGNIVSQAVFDKNGNVVPQVTYDRNGNVVPRIVYDKSGNIIPNGQIVYDKNGNIIPQVTYDRNGNVVPNVIYDKNGSIVPQTVYDKNGNIVPQVTYDRSGNVVPRIVYDKNGNVVPQITYDRNGNVVPKIVYDKNGNIVPSVQTVYDKNGNVVPQVTYDRNGNVVPQIVYDKNGNIVPGVQTVYDKNGNVVPQVTYDRNGNVVPQIVYDKNGNIVPGLQTVYDKNGNVVPQVTYDRDGNVVPQIVYDKNGNIVPGVQTVYDKNGNVVTQVTYDRNGNVVPQIVYDKNNIVPGIQTVYDKNGNVVPQVTYDRNGNVVPKIVYDKNGNVVPQVTYDRNGNVVPRIVYDKNGNIVPGMQTVYDKNGSIVPQTAYDKNGNIVPQVTYDRNGNIVPQTVYDKNGNVVPQTIYDQNGNVLPQTTYDKNGNIVSQPSQYGAKTPIIRPERPQAESDRNAVILNYENVLTPEGFAYSFDTSNGIHADESGTAVDGVKAQGAYSYIGDDGKTYSVVYSADENGFLPKGDHLPTPPPIPEAILRVIEDAKKAKEAGIIEDGSYDDNKYGYKKYQGPMERYGQSNSKKIYGPDGKPVRRPITYTDANGNEDKIDYIEEDVNEAEDGTSVNKKPSRLPSRRPSNNGQTFDRNDNGNDDNINDDGILTVGNQRIARPRPSQRPDQDYEIVKNSDGSETLVPIRRNNQPATTTYPRPNQFSSIDGQRFNVDDAVKDGKRPTSNYQGYEYLAPVKTFEVGQNDKGGNYNKPLEGSSTAKPFITQPDDIDSYQKYGDRRIPSRPSNQDGIVTERISSKFPNEYGVQSTTRPIISNTRDSAPITIYNQQNQPTGIPSRTSTLRPEYISTYRPISSSEPNFGNKNFPLTTGGTSPTPTMFSTSGQSVYPSTTYRPNYNIIKGSRGENILVDEFGRPAIQSTPSPFTPTQGTINPIYSVTQRVPTTVDASGRPVQTQFTVAPGSTASPVQTFTSQKVDGYGRPIEQTLVDGNGRPIITGPGQVDQIPGRPGYTIGPDGQISRVTSPGYKVDVYGRPVVSQPGQNFGNLPESVTPGPQQQRVTIDEYGRPVVSTDLSPSNQGNQPNQVIGENFSGPQQQQKYDAKTGYYY